ncbi:MAG: ATP-dependent helicase [Actinobacteria bacterium]|nr:ATP-dependent helicase [Actinomycetota bacterium]
MSPRSFDPQQQRVLDHARGPLLVLGAAGTGKTAALVERFARLIEGGADPERVALIVRSRAARVGARRALLARLPGSLPALRVATVHGIAYQVVQEHYRALEYEGPATILSAADQFARVRELLEGDDAADWPAYGSMLRLRGFADQVRQLILRAQEALLTPEDIERKAAQRGLSGWSELAAFYRRYLQVLDQAGLVDFAGLVMQAAAVGPRAGAPFDHVLVDDFQDTTYAAEALVSGLAAESTVVAGDPGAHVFAFQGTTDEPLRRFASLHSAPVVELTERHRGEGPQTEAWWAPHASEEYEAVARELRRVHVEETVPWRDLAVVVRRQGAHLGGLLRALDDAGVPRWLPERTLSSEAEPATHPYRLALRWIARPQERGGLLESLLASDLAGLTPAAARTVLRASTGGDPTAALSATAGLTPEEAASMERLRASLEAAESRSGSVLDAFAELWRTLPYSAHLVARAAESPEARRDLDSVVAFAELVSRAGEGAVPTVEAFLADLESGEEGPGVAAPGPEPDAVRVLTAHGCAGREFDTVVVVRALEGNFPSLTRPEPMFDLAALDGNVSRSQRLRERVADERRLFRMVVGRARRRAVFTGGASQEELGPVSRSRFVQELGIAWTVLDGDGDARAAEPLTVAEAASRWRRALADADRAPAERLAALEGLLALGSDPAGWWFQREWTDTGRPLHETMRVSYSRLDKLENCELQFVLSEELGLGSHSGYHAWVGSLVHDLIERYERGELPDKTLEAMQDAAEAGWRPQEFPSFAVSEAFRKLVRDTMLPNWFREYADTPAVATEERFEFDFDGATVTGYIDRIGPITSGGNRITDYKTGKAKTGNPAENLQLGIYFLAVDETEELAKYRPVRAVELAYVRGKWNDASKVERVPWQPNTSNGVKYRAEMRERLSGLLARLRGLVQDETYRPSTAAECHFCEFKSMCPLWPQGAPLFGELTRPSDASGNERASTGGEAPA